MNRWENLHLIVYWNGAGSQAVSVYLNGCKMDTLCGADKARVVEYLRGLKSQGWERFSYKRPAGSPQETYYFQRPMEEAGCMLDRLNSVPEPQFVHHTI